LAFQQATKIVCQESEYTNSINSGEAYRTPLPSQSIEFEITGMHPLGNGLVFISDDFKSSTGAFLEIPEIGSGGDTSSTETRKRLLSRSVQTYRSDSLEDVLPIGKMDSLGLPGRSYSLCYTRQTLAQYESAPDGRLKVPMQNLTEHGGYTTLPGYEGLWATDGTISFHPEPSTSPADELLTARQSFFFPRRSTDPFGNSSLVEYDNYLLRVIKTVDAISNTATSEIDYRILSPWASIDANQNRTEVAFDALGLVVAVAKRGKGRASSDNLRGIQRNLTNVQIQAYMTNPKSQSTSLLQEATERYLRLPGISKQRSLISVLFFHLATRGPWSRWSEYQYH
jgi:hypothetical protein